LRDPSNTISRGVNIVKEDDPPSPIQAINEKLGKIPTWKFVERTVSRNQAWRTAGRNRGLQKRKRGVKTEKIPEPANVSCRAHKNK